MQPVKDENGQTVDLLFTGTVAQWFRAQNALGALRAARGDVALPDVAQLWLVLTEPEGTAGAKAVLHKSMLPFNH